MRRAFWILGGLFLLLAGLVWLAGSPLTVRLAAGILERVAGDRIRTEGVTGSLYGPLRIDRLVVETETRRVEATGLELDWRPLALLERRLELTRLKADTVAVRKVRPREKPPEPPASLRLPLALSAPEIGVGRLLVEDSGLSLAFATLRLSLDKPARRYRLRLLTLTSPWGEGEGELEMDESRPYALHARLRHDQTGRHEVSAEAMGSLTRLQLTLTSALPQPLALRAVVAPFDPLPLQSAVLEAEGIDPARWHTGWPSAQLTARAEFSADREGKVRGRLQLTNALAGGLDTGRLPVVDLSGRFQGSVRDLALEALMLDLGRGGRLTGTGRWHQGAIRLDLGTRDLDPRALHTRMRSLRLAGRLRLEADARSQRVLAHLAYRHYALALDATRRDGTLEVGRASITAQGGRLDLTGNLGLTEPHAFIVSGRLESFDPSAFGDFPAARLNARLQGGGQFTPSLVGRLEFELGASRWRDLPLTGGGRLRLTAGRLEQADVRLALADMRFDLRGGYGRPGDRLDARLDASRLERIHPDLAGRIQAEGSLQGSLATGSAKLSATGSGLRWGQVYRLARFQAEASLQDGLDRRIELAADLMGLRLPGRGMDSAALRLEGSRLDHRLQLVAQGGNLELQARLAGGWRQGWSGEIQELQGRGRHTLHLMAPARLSWVAGRLELGPAELRYDTASLRLQSLAWREGALRSSGSFSRLDPLILPAVAELLRGWDSSLRLAGAWDFGTGDTLSGMAALWHETGDLTLPAEPHISLGLERLRLEVMAADGGLRAVLDAKGAGLGSVHAEAASRLERRGGRWGLAAAAPLTGQARLEVATLAWLGPLLDRRGTLQVNGQVHGRLLFAGSVAQPRIRGGVRGEGLTLGLPELGLNLRQGALQAEVEGDELRLTRLHLLAGDGRLTVRGSARWTVQGPHLDLEAEAAALPAMNLPTRQLVASGSARLTGQGGVYMVQGRVRADRARLLLPRDDAAQRSEDVVVLGREAEPMPSGPLGLVLDLVFDLGPRFLIEGRGLDARLEGQLRVRSAPRGHPRATGGLRVAQGSYRAYGQRLNIERGVLDFQGPLDNPGLDILAMRSGQEVEAGVAITGTALSPRARLVSRPDVPDSEKLSWLVLGRGIESASGPDLQLLSLAAGALLSAGESVSLQAQIAQATGLDEVGIKGRGSLEQTVLTLGKRLSSRAYLSYEHGLAGLGTLVRLSYTLGRRWSVKAQTGRENTVDLFYTLEFD